MAKPKIVPNRKGKHYKPSPSEDIFFTVTGSDTDGGFDHFELIVGYLDGFPLHIHLIQDETFHVIEGELRMQVGDEMVDAKAGDFLYIPKGVKHTYVNLKKEPARAIGILIPGGFDKFVDELVAYMASAKGQPDQAKVAEISARHNQRQVGPPLAVSLGLKGGGGGHGGADPKKKELDNFRGDWLVVHREMEGKEATKEELQKNETHIIFEGDKVSLKINGNEIAAGDMVANPTTAPKSFDLTWTKFIPIPAHQGRTTQAIYELSGDNLKVCMTSLDGSWERPREFATKPGSHTALVVYKRQSR